MEESMCWEMDYKFFAEQKKAEDARKQEQRTGVINKLLNEAYEQLEKANVEATPIEEVAPAK
jgi:hypothetical protein